MNFYDKSDFSKLTETLENNFSTIRQEYLNLSEEFLIEWKEHSLYTGNKWSVFGFLFQGEWIDESRLVCPKTYDALKGIENITTAGFSVLRPGTEILPHVGYTDEVLRCHMGIEVPTGDCFLEVNGEKRNWVEGECFIFDDTVEHSAWNRTDSDRVVFLVDILRPEMA